MASNLPKFPSWSMGEEGFESRQSGCHATVLISQTWRTKWRPLRELGREEIQVLGSVSAPLTHSGNQPLSSGYRLVSGPSIKVNPQNTGSGQSTNSGGKGISMYRTGTMTWTLNPLTSQQPCELGTVTSIHFIEEENKAQRVTGFAQGHRARIWQKLDLNPGLF